jgi:hypothetical protein
MPLSFSVERRTHRNDQIKHWGDAVLWRKRHKPNRPAVPISGRIMRVRAVWAALFSVLAFWPVAWPMQARQLSGPLVFAPRCHGFWAFNTFKHTGEIGFSGVSLVETVFKFKLITEPNQDYAAGTGTLSQKIEQFHFWDHRRSGLALVHGDTDAKYITPVRSEFADQGARGCADDSVEILNRGIPNEISSRRLSRVRGDDPDHRMSLSTQHSKTYKQNLTIADIDISPDLSFADASRLIDRCLHVAGLTNARPDDEFELFLASGVEDNRSSKTAKTLSLAQVFRMTDAEAETAFKMIR